MWLQTIAVAKQKVIAEKTKAKSKGQCWMWSDPHVETLGGASADFMPHKDPVHTLVAKEGGYQIQSYHCPVVQETCRPDYYPCDASAAVAYAGSFVDKSGAPRSVVMWGQRVITCGPKKCSARMTSRGRCSA